MLPIDLVQKKERTLEQYIKELAQRTLDDTDAKKFAYKLQDLYTQDFRHSYSKFFPIITDLGKDRISSLEYLSYNLETLKKIVEQDFLNGEKIFKGLDEPLSKLSDHLSLEIARYSYYSEKEARTKDLESNLLKAQDNVKNLEKELKHTREELDKATEELNLATDKIKSVQGELITVLSIFAAIVMTFSGSLNVLGNVLNGTANLPLPKLIFLLLLCGFILINFIFAMMYFIAKITGRNIYARCETLDCTCIDNIKPKCCGIVRVFKRLPYIFWLNALIFLAILVDICSYLAIKLNN